MNTNTKLGWTAEKNLVHRQEYAPEILADLKELLDEIEERGDLLPKSELQEAITTYAMNGMQCLISSNMVTLFWTTIRWSV